jgi:O-antigen ligase
MRNLVLGLLMAMVFQIPWEGMGALGTFGTLIRAIGIGTFFLGIIAVLTTGRFRGLLLIHYLMILFVSFAVLSLTWTQDVELTLEYLMTYCQLLAFAWLIWEFAPDPFRQRLLIQAYILGGFVGIMTQFLGHFRSSSEATALAAQRLTGGALNLNEFAIDLLMSIPIAVYCATEPKVNRLLRIAYMIYCPVCALSILLTGSRMGFVAMCVMAILLGLFYLFKRPVLTIGLSLIMVVPFFFLFSKFMPESTWERVSTSLEEIQTGDWSGRLHIYEVGLVLFQEYPILGTGSGTFMYAFGQVSPERGHITGSAAHNTYLNVMVELGSVGFLIFLAILIVAGIYTFKMSFRERYTWQIMLYTWGVSAFALHMDYFKLFWLMLALIACQFATFKKKDIIKIPIERLGAINTGPRLLVKPR